MRLLTTFLIVCAMGLFACSALKETGTPKAHRSRDYISPEEIHNSSASTAYDLIKNLRPQWLWGRGQKSIRHEEAAEPVVYVNGNKHGNIDTLYEINAENITEIRFINASEAAIRFGLNHAGGAILIVI